MPDVHLGYHIVSRDPSILAHRCLLSNGGTCLLQQLMISQHVAPCTAQPALNEGSRTLCTRISKEVRASEGGRRDRESIALLA